MGFSWGQGHAELQYDSRWIWGAIVSVLIVCLAVEVCWYSDRRIALVNEPASSLDLLATKAQYSLVNTFDRLRLSDEEKSILATLTLGYKKAMSRETKRRFSLAGVSHILAVSGFHVAVICGFLSFFCSFMPRWGIGRWVRYIILVGSLWGFVFITGLAPSAVRAALMLSLYLTGRALRRVTDGYNTLAAAAFCMLAYNPYYLFDVGFQLSFMAVLGIFLFYPLIDSLFVVRNKIVAYLWNIISLSLSAQLATLPLILYYFGTFPVYFLLSNLVVAPIAVFILSATLLALALGVFPVAANFVVQGLDFAVRTLNEVMEQIQHWSGAQITSAYLSVWQAWLLAVAIVTLWRYVVCRNARRLIVFLLTVNVLIVSFLWKQRELAGAYIYLSRAGVYTKYDRDINELSSASCIYKVRDICIVLVDNNKWRKQKALSPLHVDYAYICREFYGSVADLKRLFQIKQVVLDTSLEDSYREKLKRECEIYGLNYIDMSEKGSYAILL